MPRVTFITADGAERAIDARSGQTLLDIAWDNEIDIEGACGGSMACSTCHLIVDAAFYDRLPPPSEEEEDLLDLAWGLTPTSRLGCQIVLTDALDGLVVRLPAETRNMLG
jgi:2Fe-2S ferredoxin